MSSITPIFLLLGALVAIGAGGLVFMWLVRLTRTPQGAEKIVALLLALLVAESAMYANPSDVPTGLFHPAAGPLSFRIFDLLVPAAIVARLVARPPPQLISVQTLAWSAFLVWLTGAAVNGFLLGNSTGLIAYHAKAIIYIGTFVLVAAVPADRWLQSRSLRIVVCTSSAVAFVLMLTSQTGIGISLALPLVPLVGLGGLGSDMATIFAVMGLVTFAVGLCSPQHRLRTIGVALPMLLSPLASGQRAAMIGLGASVVVCMLVGPWAMRNVRLTLAELGIGTLAAVGLVTALLLAGSLSPAVSNKLPIARQIQETFTSRGKQLSEQDRVNQWAQARELIAQRPVFGWGLAKQYNYYSPGFYEFMTTDLTHNIGLDLLLRTGIVGLLLFVVAVATTVRDGVLTWLRDIDARIAALGLACVGALIGLITKGMFESIFEKYRLALVMGGLVGLALSVSAARRTAPATAPRRLPLDFSDPRREALVR